MKSITAESVCQAAENFCQGTKMSEFVKIAPDFSVRSDFVDCFKRLGLQNIDSILCFCSWQKPGKTESGVFSRKNNV